MTGRAITPIEGKILRVVYHHAKHGVPLTIYEIAKHTGYTYPTVKKYVEKLINEGVLKWEKDVRKD